jgi:hypothetical protein
MPQIYITPEEMEAIWFFQSTTQAASESSESESFNSKYDKSSKAFSTFEKKYFKAKAKAKSNRKK